MKEEFIARYGEVAYERKLEQRRAYYKAHREEGYAANKRYKEKHREEINVAAKKYREKHKEEVKVADKKYKEAHSEKVIVNNQEHGRKGGKHYDQALVYKRTGLQGARNKVRSKHAREYKPYKDIIAPDSQIHHEWLPDSSEYTGVALVEANPHRYGIIDVIIILDGKITILTEEEVRKGKKK